MVHSVHLLLEYSHTENREALPEKKITEMTAQLRKRRASHKSTSKHSDSQRGMESKGKLGKLKDAGPGKLIKEEKEDIGSVSGEGVTSWNVNSIWYR